MTHKLQPQVDILLHHSLDQQGVVDLQLVASVLQAYHSSKAPHKSQVMRLYKQQIRRLQTQQQAVITSSTDATTKLQSDIKAYISQTHPHIKSFVWQVDPELVGGFTILVGDMWHDSSITHQLHTIREQLSQ